MNLQTVTLLSPLHSWEDSCIMMQKDYHRSFLIALASCLKPDTLYRKEVYLAYSVRGQQSQQRGIAMTKILPTCCITNPWHHGGSV